MELNDIIIPISTFIGGTVVTFLITNYMGRKNKLEDNEIIDIKKLISGISSKMDALASSIAASDQLHAVSNQRHDASESRLKSAEEDIKKINQEILEIHKEKNK